MKTSHEGLAITETEWEVSIDCARKVLERLGVAEPYKVDVVEVPAKASESAA